MSHLQPWVEEALVQPGRCLLSGGEGQRFEHVADETRRARLRWRGGGDCGGGDCGGGGDDVAMARRWRGFCSGAAFCQTSKIDTNIDMLLHSTP